MTPKAKPDVPEAANELVEALLTAPGKNVAERFVTDWLRIHAVAPKPADIYMAFNPPGSLAVFSPVTEPSCPVCGGTGWEIVEHDAVSSARSCQCRRAEELSSNRLPESKGRKQRPRRKEQHRHDEMK